MVVTEDCAEPILACTYASMVQLSELINWPGNDITNRNAIYLQTLHIFRNFFGKTAQIQIVFGGLS